MARDSISWSRFSTAPSDCRRKPIQIQPFSRKHFASNHGKTECWVILATRPGAKLFFGFKEGVTESDLREP